MTNELDITAVILAGGKGSRMGGNDKGLMPLEGKPLIQHVIDAIRPQVSKIIINANRNIEEYENLGFPVIQDDLGGYQGPLAGFLSALDTAETSDVVFVPCDSPFITQQLVSRLNKERDRTNQEIAVAHDGERLQPVYALIPTNLKQSLKDYLDSGDRKIDLWYLEHKTAHVDFSDATESFVNINTQDDFSSVNSEMVTA